MKNYYKTLGVNKNATLQEIKTAYRKLTLKFHPDRNSSPDASKIFIEITEAYEVLRDETKRAQFDSFFRNETTSDINKNVYQDKWQKYGKEKATEYSNMNFEEFSKKMFNEVLLGVSYIPSLLFGIFVILMGVVGGGFLLINGLEDENYTMAFIYSLLTLAFLGWFGSSIIGGAKHNYLNDRKKL